MCNARACSQQCWKSCANGSNIVALRFGDHRTTTKKVGSCWRKSLTGFKLCAATPNNPEQHAASCNRVCRPTQHVTTNNVASVCSVLYNNMERIDSVLLKPWTLLLKITFANKIGKFDLEVTTFQMAVLFAWNERPHEKISFENLRSVNGSLVLTIFKFGI